MPRSINNYANAANVYANSKWKYWSPLMRNVAVLFNNNKTSKPFYIKNGKRHNFTVKEANGLPRLFFGPRNYNYLMNVPVNFTASNFKKRGQLQKRRRLLNTTAAYKVRAVKRAFNNKRRAAQNERVNKLVNNVLSGRNVSKARLPNLVQLVIRYQNANAGPYYSKKEGQRTLTNNHGRKLTRKQVLNNIAEMKEYNYFYY